MTLAEQFSEWVKTVGNSDPEQGLKESLQWVEELDSTQEEMNEFFCEVADKAMLTALAEGNIMQIVPNMIYYALRFGIDIEMKKHLPSL